MHKNFSENTNDLELTYYGYFVPHSGYGILNWNRAIALSKAGTNVYISPKFDIAKDSFSWSELTYDQQELLNKERKISSIGLIEQEPWTFSMCKSPIKIASLMCESDKIAGSWVENINSVDLVIVPNNFCKQVFIKSGVYKPIKIVSPGVSEQWEYIEREKKKVFTFGICGWLERRKGVFDIIQAFVSEFNKKEKVRLLLHSINDDFGYYRNFTDKRIKTTTKLKTPQQLLEFYYSLDCFVFPSKAEGIGYPPREAMATGLPVILTKWSGLEDIALEEISYPLIPSSFSKREDHALQPGNWANIDLRELMYQMRYVYENQEEARKKGIKASRFIWDNYGWEESAQSLISIIKQYDKSVFQAN